MVGIGSKQHNMVGLCGIVLGGAIMTEGIIIGYLYYYYYIQYIYTIS